MYREMDVYILNCRDGYGCNYYELEIYEEEDVCPSEWQSATYGCGTLKRVYKHRGHTHRLKDGNPIRIQIVTDRFDNLLDQENELFKIDRYGGDEYYPYGEISINMDLFIPTTRYSDKRKVYIFMGASSLGKSYLASLMEKDKHVYETDSNDSLPDSIYQDIIVRGNKYQYDVKDIERRIYGRHETIIVDFKKYME